MSEGKMTEDEMADARTFWVGMMANESIPLSYPEVKRLEELGLVEGLERKPGRGRYAGRWTATWTNKLAELMGSNLRMF